MDMNELEALAIAARELLRSHAYAKSVAVTALNGNDGLTVEVTLQNIDGTITRIVHTGEAPF